MEKLKCSLDHHCIKYIPELLVWHTFPNFFQTVQNIFKLVVYEKGRICQNSFMLLECGPPGMSKKTF